MKHILIQAWILRKSRLKELIKLSKDFIKEGVRSILLLDPFEVIIDNLLEMKGIYKNFPGVKALDNVDFYLKKGEL